MMAVFWWTSLFTSRRICWVVNVCLSEADGGMSSAFLIVMIGYVLLLVLWVFVVRCSNVIPMTISVICDGYSKDLLQTSTRNTYETEISSIALVITRKSTIFRYDWKDIQVQCMLESASYSLCLRNLLLGLVKRWYDLYISFHTRNNVL